MIERTANIVSEDGIVKMTSKGWGGIIFRINKDKFASSILNTDKLEHCDGIYILVGKKSIRVGKGDIYSRVGDHRRCNDPKRNFFDYVIVITSPISGLDDTQQGYIEHKWIKKLKDYKKYKVTNDVTPDCPSNIQEHDRVSTEEFMTKAEKFIHDICNEEIFEDVRNHSKKTVGPVNTLSQTNDLGKLVSFVGKEFVCKNSMCEAKGIYLGDGKIKVLKGSTMRMGHVDSYTLRQIEFRELLVKQNKIVLDNTHYVVQDDIDFSSLSAASSIVLGNSSNGRLDWKCGGKSINEFLV